MEKSRGTCFGFEIVSRVPFRSLRDGHGETLRVEVAGSPPEGDGELVFDWRAPRFHAQIRFDGRVHTFAVDDLGTFLVDTVSRRITAPPIDDLVVLEELLWGMPALLCFLRRGDVPLHAAAVEVGGGALILAAPGTHGKSTLAAAFAERGYRMLTEDVVCLRAGTRPEVLPGPASIRLRKDVAEELGLERLQPATPERGRRRYLVPRAERGTGHAVPLRAVIFLRRADDRPRLEPVAAPRALPDLWRLTFRLEDDERARSFRLLVDAASGVPVYDLHRRLRIDELPATVDAIVAEVG